MAGIEYAVLGAGALGSIVAAHLARAGHNVVVLARGARAALIGREGIRIQGLVDFTVPVVVVTDPGTLSSAQTLIVATKAIATAASLEPLRGVRIAAALSLQNGVLKDELLAGAFGAERVLGGVANFSGELLPSGAVTFTRNINLLVGEPDGARSERVQRVVRDLDGAGIRASASDHIRSQEWSKLAAWIGLVALATTVRRATWQYLCDPGAALVLVRLVREMGRLASAYDVELADDAMFPVGRIVRSTDAEAVAIVLAIGNDMHRIAPLHRVSTLQDLEAGRRLEVEETIGHVVQLADRRRLELPLLDTFYRLVTAMDLAQASSG